MKCKHEWVLEKKDFYVDGAEYEVHHCKKCLASALVEFPEGVRTCEVTECVFLHKSEGDKDGK